MSEKTDTFIRVIAPLAQAEYQNRSRWVLPSVCIAQAALESGWNPKARTLFGIKGKGVSMNTVEYINGRYVDTTASFKSYPNLAAAVHGYYDLITGNARYGGAVNNPDPHSAIIAIKNGGYATDPSYVAKVWSIIRNYGLTKYDARQPQHKAVTADVVTKVIRGVYGNGATRRQRLEAEGYDYSEVQAAVNRRLRG